jgi:hypothetical protein
VNCPYSVAPKRNDSRNIQGQNTGQRYSQRQGQQNPQRSVNIHNYPTAVPKVTTSFETVIASEDASKAFFDGLKSLQKASDEQLKMMRKLSTRGRQLPATATPMIPYYQGPLGPETTLNPPQPSQQPQAKKVTFGKRMSSQKGILQHKDSNATGTKRYPRKQARPRKADVNEVACGTDGPEDSDQEVYECSEQTTHGDSTPAHSDIEYDDDPDPDSDFVYD